MREYFIFLINLENTQTFLLFYPHAVSRMCKDRKRKNNATLYSKLSAQFSKHCLLRSRTQRRILSYY